MSLYCKASYLDYLRKYNPQKAKEWEEDVAKGSKYEMITWCIVIYIFLYLKLIFNI